MGDIALYGALSGFAVVLWEGVREGSAGVGVTVPLRSEATKIVVDLPHDLAQHADPGRDALEALTIAGYCSGELSNYQARQLLGFSRFSSSKNS